ncbi:DUF1697 domain-containing protein [Roseibium sp. M-1]
MTVFIALLRAVNVGGTGKLPMADLRAMAQELGFEKVSTYIQSGNLVFSSDLPGEEVHVRLTEALTAYLGKPASVILRTSAEFEDLDANMPFQDALPNQLLITFLSGEAAADALDGLVAPSGEEAAIRGREIFVHFPNGMGGSKMKLPALKSGTGRNLNTVRKLLEMAREKVG